MQGQQRILIADDDASMRDVVAAQLADGHWELSFAADGREALEQASGTPRPDLLLLDVMMPVMDGFEVLARVRADPRLRELPVILVTALDDRQSRIRGLETGADEFLSKPFDGAELRARVKTIMALGRYRRLLAERARFEWVVASADDGFVLLSRDDAILYANERARLLLELPASGAEGHAFRDVAARGYRLQPDEAWASWPSPSEGGPRYVVRPESPASRPLWLRADIHEGPDTSERVVRIVDVTAEVTLRQEQWAFQSMVSHKLRTPLNGLLGTLDFLKDDAALPADERRELDSLALQSGERLRDTVDDILEHVAALHLSSSRSAALEVSTVAGLAEGIAAGLDLAPPAVTISDSLHGRSLGISTVAAECILRELLDNAKKFHPGSGPAVQVAVEQASPGLARVEVSDDGPGIPPSQLGRVLAAYYQGEKDFTGELRGMGLGLTTVASLVWAAGGQCRLFNRTRSGTAAHAAGRSGLTVEITLPLGGG